MPQFLVVSQQIPDEDGVRSVLFLVLLRPPQLLLCLVHFICNRRVDLTQQSMN